MLLRECNSCSTQVHVRSEAAPVGWADITVVYKALDFHYMLCPECAGLPMTFGKLDMTF